MAVKRYDPIGKMGSRYRHTCRVDVIGRDLESKTIMIIGAGSPENECSDNLNDIVIMVGNGVEAVIHNDIIKVIVSLARPQVFIGQCRITNCGERIIKTAGRIVGIIIYIIGASVAIRIPRASASPIYNNSNNCRRTERIDVTDCIMDCCSPGITVSRSESYYPCRSFCKYSDCRKRSRSRHKCHRRRNKSSRSWYIIQKYADVNRSVKDRCCIIVYCNRRLNNRAIYCN